MEVLYLDEDILVCIKPPRVLSTDEPGGVPELARQELGQPQADMRTVHRLDRVVSGVMVLARSAQAASELSRQIREGSFQKEYLAVIHGSPAQDQGQLRDLLYRDKARRMTMVAQEPGKGIQEVLLDYQVLGRREGLSLVKIRLHTGRTHQIRVQFASRGMPLVGERKYSTLEDDCQIALWSHALGFVHPTTGKPMSIRKQPSREYPWELF